MQPVFNGFCMSDAAFQPASMEYAIALAAGSSRDGARFVAGIPAGRYIDHPNM